MIKSSSILSKTIFIFLFFGFVLRLFLTIKYHNDLAQWQAILSFTVGILFDIIVASYFALLPTIYYCLLPKSFLPKQLIFSKIIYFLFLLVMVFSFFAEIIFFDEFQTRFNFIAIDYLIYTQEVVANIIESYPIFWLIVGILIISSIIFALSYRFIFNNTQKYKTSLFAIIIILVTDFFFINNQKINKIISNKYQQELAFNGIYQLFSAFFNNQIDFERFYLNIDNHQAQQLVRMHIAQQEPNSVFLDNNSIARLIQSSQPARPYNIMFVAIESLSADFMQYFGNTSDITPNLDNLAKKGLFFTNLKATGTRTVRGLEALTLSIPPTPGNSIVRRPHNENLFNIASPLIDLQYDAKFLYGGNGFFDNMSYFFANNGFTVIDRRKFTKDEISFANAWGVADEDLFNKAIKEADYSYQNNKKFFNFILTTSNHRPFTYPDGKIDIPSKTNRNGAVKYSDYAIGKFISDAQKKPWFADTIFVFIADHCAGSAGNSDVPIWRYQIPAIFYAPQIIQPQIFAKNISQIDIAPTLLGILNLQYKSKFFGSDVLKNNISERAFVSTYSDLGYYKNNELYVLKLRKQHQALTVNIKNFGYQGSSETPSTTPNKDILEQSIAYYQTASILFKNGQLQNFAK